MPRRLQRHLHLLRVLEKADQKLRAKLIRSSDEDLVRCICECALNTLKGNVPLTPAEKRKLSPHKGTIRKLAVRHPSVKQKRSLLLQKGGAFLPLLLAPVISALVSKLIAP